MSSPLIYTALQNQKAVAAYLTSKQLQHFDFAGQYKRVCPPDNPGQFHLWFMNSRTVSCDTMDLSINMTKIQASIHFNSKNTV